MPALRRHSYEISVLALARRRLAPPLGLSEKPSSFFKEEGSVQQQSLSRSRPHAALFNIAAMSDWASLIGMMLNFSTSTFRTFGVTKAGNVGPSRILRMQIGRASCRGRV